MGKKLASFGSIHVARSLSLAFYKTFSTLIVLSADPVANHWLPGSTATDLTQPVWPLITYNKQSQMDQINDLNPIHDSYLINTVSVPATREQ